jgi:predicted RecA/RadA family phage recombinase
MGDAAYRSDECERRITVAATVASGEVHQLPSGRAGVKAGLNSAESGDMVVFQEEGKFEITKASGVVFLDGGCVYWDHSANAATYKPVNDRDFFVGVAVGDAASAATTMVVDLNKKPVYTLDAVGGRSLSVATGTAAAGGFGLPPNYGGSLGLSLTATSEAQCIDLLSVDRVAVGSNPIVEGIIRLGANGSTSAVDFNLGLANGTSTTDADAITEHVLFHVDGGALDILAQSKDGTTTVTATDTTIDITAGSAVANAFEFWIDARNPANVALYINGARVLSGTTFVLTNATGPLGVIAHLEKTTGTATAGPVYIDKLCARTMEY